MKNTDIDVISKTTFNYYDIPIDWLNSKSRKRELVQARQVAMYFSKILTKASLATIGAQIGGKDHATVLHARKTVNNLMDTDKNFRKQVEDIEKKVLIALGIAVKYDIRDKDEIIDRFEELMLEKERLQLQIPSANMQVQNRIMEDLEKLNIELNILKWCLNLNE